MNKMNDVINKLHGSLEDSLEINQVLDIRKTSAENAMIKSNKRLKKMQKQFDAHEKKQAKKDFKDNIRSWLTIIIAIIALVVAIISLIL